MSTPLNVDGALAFNRRDRLLWAAVLAGLVITVAAGVGLLGALWYLTLLVVLCGLVVWDPLNAFYIFVVLTPVHTLAMILVYRAVGETGLVMTLFLAWKELVLVWAACVAFFVLGRGTVLLRPTWADRLALLYMAIAVLYVVLPRIPGDESDLTARLYGFRESVLPALVYLVGRATPTDWRRLRRALAWLVGAAVVWSAVGLVEAVYDPGNLLRAIGYTQFQINVLQASGELNPEGLAYTYTTSEGIRRVGSLFLHPLGFAIALLFVLPLLMGRAMDRKRGYAVASAMAIAALFATLSRGPLAILVLMVVLLLFWRERLSARAVVLGGLAVVVVSLPFAVVGVLRQYVFDTLAARDSSTVARLANLAARLATLAQHLWLGTGVSSATRMGEVGGAESEMLQIALRFGLVGLGVYLAFVVSLVRAFWRRRRSSNRTEFMWAGISLLCLNIYGFINPLWRSGFHTMGIWLAWGLIASQAFAENDATQGARAKPGAA